MRGAVDAHHHLWDPGHRVYPWMTDEVAPLRRSFGLGDLLPELELAGVVQTVVVQAVGTVEETEDLLGLAARSPVVAGVVGWVDLQAPDVGDALARLRRCRGGEHLAGIRHQVQDEPDPDWILGGAVRRGLGAVAAAGLVFDLLVRERQLPSARRALAAVPGLRVVVDHAAKPPIAEGRWEPWASEVAALAQLDGVACKLSGLVTEADWEGWRPAQLEPYVDWILQCFGPERCLFGSDWPVCTLAASYSQVAATMEGLLGSLGEVEREAVFAANARRIYGLPAAAAR